MLKSFDDNVRDTLKHHDVQDDKLENALIDLFNQYDRRFLSKDFIDKIEQELEKRKIRKSRVRGD